MLVAVNIVVEVSDSIVVVDRVGLSVLRSVATVTVLARAVFVTVTVL